MIAFFKVHLKEDKNWPYLHKTRKVGKVSVIFCRLLMSGIKISQNEVKGFK